MDKFENTQNVITFTTYMKKKRKITVSLTTENHILKRKKTRQNKKPLINS